MTDNPFHSPSTAPEDAPHPPAGPLPAGVLILGALHLTFGMLPILMGTWLRASSLLGMVVGLSVSAVAAAAGVGLLLKAKWGWWIASYLYLLSSLRSFFELIALAGQSNLTVLKVIYFPRVCAIIVGLLLVWYMLRPGVMACFRLQRLKRTNAVVILLAVFFLLSAVVAAAQWYSEPALLE